MNKKIQKIGKHYLYVHWEYYMHYDYPQVEIRNHSRKYIHEVIIGISIIILICISVYQFGNISFGFKRSPSAQGYDES